MCMFTCKRKKMKENRPRNIKRVAFYDVQNESHSLRQSSRFPSLLSIQCDELAANYLRGTFEGLRQTF